MAAGDSLLLSSGGSRLKLAEAGGGDTDDVLLLASASLILRSLNSSVRISSPYSINRASPQARGLEAAYPNHTWRDVAGNNNGTIISAPPSTAGVGGQLASDFDGTSDYVDLPYIPTVPFSVSAWFRIDSEPNANGAIFSVADSSSAIERHILVVESLTDDKIAAISTASGATTFSTTGAYGPVIEEGVWHHAVGVWAADNSRTVFLDGVEYATNTTTVNVTGLDTSEAGRLADATPNWEFDGPIFDLRVYSRAISAAEVRRMYAPATRWELYNHPRAPLILGGAAAESSRSVLSQQGLIHTIGQDTLVSLGRALETQQGLVYVIGQDSQVSLGRALETQQGLVYVIGQSAEVGQGRQAFSESGLIHLLGQDTSVVMGRESLTESGLIYVVGQDASVKKGNFVPAWARLSNNIIIIGTRGSKS